MKKWHFPKSLSRHVVGYAILGVVVVIGATFGTWRLLKLFSPVTNDSTGNTTIILKSSDHSPTNCSSPKVPLANNLTDSTTPCYTDTINNGPTILTPTATGVTLFRIQGEINYK